MISDNPDIWLDSDGDGTDDGADKFPFEPSQQFDSDGDGYGDNRFGGATSDFFPNDPTMVRFRWRWIWRQPERHQS